MWDVIPNAEGGVRTHVPLRTNGFQDRLVMTTSIPLQAIKFLCRTHFFKFCVVFGDLLTIYYPFIIVKRFFKKRYLVKLYVILLALCYCFAESIKKSC